MIYSLDNTDDIESIIHFLHNILDINPKSIILHTKESFLSYYTKSNYLADIQFQIDFESKHCLELCKMLQLVKPKGETDWSKLLFSQFCIVKYYFYGILRRIQNG